MFIKPNKMNQTNNFVSFISNKLLRKIKLVNFAFSYFLNTENFTYSYKNKGEDN